MLVRVYDDDSDDSDNYHDDCRGENGDQNQLLAQWNLDMPKHQKRDGDDCNIFS